MGIEFYKQQFEKLGKADIFELNKPFIEEICALKERIQAVRSMTGNNYIIKHPSVEGRFRVPESEIWLLKLEEQYKNMIVALNKLVGGITNEENDPIEEWLHAHGSQLNE